MNQRLKDLIVTGGVVTIAAVGGVALTSPEEVVIAPVEQIEQGCQIEEPNYDVKNLGRKEFKIADGSVTVIGPGDIENEILIMNYESECSGEPIMTDEEADTYRLERIADMEEALEKAKVQKKL